MDWKDVGKKLLGIGAPILGVALGGPVGGLAAQTAVNLISNKTGIKLEDITPDGINALLESPESRQKLLETEIEGKTELQKAINEETQMYLRDRQSARQRETEIVKVTGEKDINLYILAWIVISGFFGMTTLLVFKALPSGSPEAIFMLFGALASGFGAVVQYFFGSSKSSKDKTKLLVNNVG